MEATNKMQQLFRFFFFFFFKSALHVLGDIRPSSGTLFDYMYSFWYNAPTLLQTGATAEMELNLNRGTGRQL